MANNYNVQDELQKVNAQRRLLEAQQRRNCDHSGQGNIVPLNKYNGHVPHKDCHTSSTVICTRCGEIFESETYKPSEVQNMFFMQRSMIQQIQLITGKRLTDAESETLVKAQETLDALIEPIGPFYNDMVKKLGQDNKGKGGNKQNHKGGVGITSGMYSGR
jgi:hypothetical protein